MLEPNHSDTLAIIPLRAGSKGLLGKNLRPLAGKPLYLHSCEPGPARCRAMHHFHRYP